MVEVSYAEPSGSPSTSRRGTFSSDFQGDDERLRLGSTTSNTFTLPQSRHLSVSTKVHRRLSMCTFVILCEKCMVKEFLLKSIHEPLRAANQRL